MPSQNQPNILWIMTDQQRADALGCVSSWMHTPNLDRLAAQSARLSHCFVQSPVCVPSRASMMTGRYAHAHKVRRKPGLLPGEPHLFRLLKSAGYQTGLVGKDHVFSPDETHAFDIYGPSEKVKFSDEWGLHLHQIKEDMKNVGSWAGARFHDLPEEGSSTHVIGEGTISALEQFAQSEEPFFLWSSFLDPHAPHTAPRRFESLYPLDKMPLPDGALGEKCEELEGKPRRQQMKRQAQLMPDATETDVRRYLAVYGAMISFVDEWVGKILDKLDEVGLSENTVVVFTSDHGDFRGEHGMVKKDLVLYDALMRVPLMVRYPGVVEAQVLETMVEQIDLHPTLCEWAGVEVPVGVQGRSLVPLLTGQTQAHRNEVFAEQCAPDMLNPYDTFDEFIADWRANWQTDDHLLQWTASFNVPGDFTKCIRTQTHKYVWYVTGEEELYDLENDAGETRNLAHEQPELCRDLKGRLFEWHVRSEDPLDAGLRAQIERDYPWEAQ